jgi:dTDP-4-dehydrorhamnose 3,5-epimerase
MNVSKTDLEGVLIIEPSVFIDERGWFAETYNFAEYAEYGIDAAFIQDNHSQSLHEGTLRGLHFQNAPMAQCKLVRCTRGKILDVAVDLRKGSSTFSKWIKVELSEENRKQLFIPRGFAHGFLTLSDGAEVQYKVDNKFDKNMDRSIRFDDPTIDIDWPEYAYILSVKDMHAPMLFESDVNFTYEKENMK